MTVIAQTSIPGVIDPIKRVRENRAPLTSDYRNFELGDEWLDESSNDWYKLASLAGNSALWVIIGGTGVSVESITVDAFTPPGTNPVVPNASNNLTVTGGQVSSGTIGANVIQTRSLAANTFTVQVQQSGSAASEDTTLNGVCHFDSSSFTVTNGFVELIGGTQAIEFINVDNGVSPVIPDPTDGSIDFPDGNGISHTGSGTPNNILTTNMSSPFTGDFTFQSTTSADTEILLVQNTSDTADSSSQIVSQVAGSSAADPIISWVVSGQTQYNQYIDNSDSDSLKLDLQGTGTFRQFFTTGERLLPFQPVFIADVNTNIPDVTGDDTQYTIVYDTVRLDVGSNFSGGTTFTAPQTGQYLFIFRTRLTNIGAAHTLGEMQILNSGVQGYNLNMGNLAAMRGAAPNLNGYGANLSCIADLTLGDTVTTNVTVYNSTKTVAIEGGGTGTTDNSFSGFFLG